MSCWCEIPLLSDGVDARQCCDDMSLLYFIVHEDVGNPRNDELDVGAVPGFGAGTVVGR